MKPFALILCALVLHTCCISVTCMDVCILSWAVADAKTRNPFECESVGNCVANPANIATAMVDRMVLSK